MWRGFSRLGYPTYFTTSGILSGVVAVGTLSRKGTDVKLADDEYKGDNELDNAYDRLSDEDKAAVDQIVN